MNLLKFNWCVSPTNFYKRVTAIALDQQNSLLSTKNEEYFPYATHWDYDFAYQICVGDDGGDQIQTNKRKFRHDDEWKVSVVWNVIRSFYCSDDRTRLIVDVDFKTVTFHDLELGLFTKMDEDG